MELLQKVCRAVATPLLWPILGMPGRSFSGSLPPLTDEELQVKQNLERLVHHLAVDIGERHAASYASLLRAEQLIADTLQGYGYAVRTQPFQFSGVEMHNIEAELVGSTRPQEIVVAGAHHDTVVGSPGADDNATGVAAMLEIGRLLKGRLNGRTLRLVGFGNEENQGGGAWELMGSWHYARECKLNRDNVVGMVSLEMLGVYSDTPNTQHYPFPFNLLYPNRGNFVGFVGNLGSRRWVRKCIGQFRQNCAFPSEGVAAPEMFRDINRSDHWSFWQFGYPGLMVTDTSNFRNKLYHTLQDTPDILDFDRFARVTVGMARMIERLVNDA
jgi:hypothetical protein